MAAVDLYSNTALSTGWVCQCSQFQFVALAVGVNSLVQGYFSGVAVNQLGSRQEFIDIQTKASHIKATVLLIRPKHRL